MVSVISKFNTLISANLHNMLDSSLRRNSLKVIDEYIRQAERNIDDLESSAATVGGNSKSLKRKYEEFMAQVEALDGNIDVLLQKGKNELAMAAQTDLNNKQKIAEEYRQQWQRLEDEFQELMLSRRRLEHRLLMIRQQREQLRALMELIATKQLANRTTRSLDALAGTGDDDIRRITEGILSQLDHAEAEAEVLGSRLQNQVDDQMGRSEIEMQLKERRRRLGFEESE